VGEVTLPLLPGQWCGVGASLNGEPAGDLEAALERRLDHDRRAVSTAIASSPAMRDAPLLAKQLATLDILTGGRLIEPTGAYGSSASTSVIDIWHLPGR